MSHTTIESVEEEDSREINHRRNDAESPLWTELASYVCLTVCAIRAVLSCGYHLSSYPLISNIVLLHYAVIGFLNKLCDRSQFESAFELSRRMASMVPVIAMNAHMLRYNADPSRNCNELTVVLSLIALPCILKIVNTERTESTVDIVVWSNICTLGLKAIDRRSIMGLIIAVWQGAHYLIAQNSRKWLLVGPEIPFNLGLCGSCILFCHLHSCHV